MPRPGGGSMGHSAHNLKHGSQPKNGRFKLAKMRDANAPAQFSKRPQMFTNFRDLFRR